MTAAGGGGGGGGGGASTYYFTAAADPEVSSLRLTSTIAMATAIAPWAVTVPLVPQHHQDQVGKLYYLCTNLLVKRSICVNGWQIEQ